MKLSPVGSELFQARGKRLVVTDRRKDMAKLIVAFAQFCELAWKEFLSTSVQRICRMETNRIESGSQRAR